ncbi:hypothetical protein N7456_008778 [Penicillium angulare]|uniref:BTB domain-containing protein n=1 Tax=Penicillium angulare TaxID=116970 RepID=A0A9W9F3Q3_9EURO|nr:hypothetical protein N7456_008778 [Penicillium angulare]
MVNVKRAPKRVSKSKWPDLKTKFLRSKTIQIDVGKKKESFTVHEQLIFASSPFFKAAFTGKWKESKERIISLPQDDPDAFAIYAHWLYYKTIPEHDDFNAGTMTTLVKAYIMGDKILDRSFQNKVIDRIYNTGVALGKDGTRYVPDCGSIALAYEETPPDSLLRLLLIDLWTKNVKACWIPDDWLDKVPSDFAIALIRRLAGVQKVQKRKLDITAEDYHLPAEPAS